MGRDRPESDEELVESARRGDAEAFEALYLRYRDWVYRLAWRFAGNREDALDVLQETFAYLLGKFPQFELTAAMTTFLYPVVKHLAIATRNRSDRVRSDAVRRYFQDALTGTLQTPGGSRADLAAALGALPDDQREVVLMRFVDSMSLQEIAAGLGIPVGTVKSRLHNALNTLRSDRRTRDYFLE